MNFKQFVHKIPWELRTAITSASVAPSKRHAFLTLLFFFFFKEKKKTKPKSKDKIMNRKYFAVYITAFREKQAQDRAVSDSN